MLCGKITTCYLATDGLDLQNEEKDNQHSQSGAGNNRCYKGKMCSSPPPPEDSQGADLNYGAAIPRCAEILSDPGTTYGVAAAADDGLQSGRRRPVHQHPE